MTSPRRPHRWITIALGRICAKCDQVEPKAEYAETPCSGVDWQQLEENSRAEEQYRDREKGAFTRWGDLSRPG